LARKRFRILRFWLFGLALLAAASNPALAHRETTDRAAPLDGISIPSLTHGQMKVISDNLAAIRELADAQFPTDPVMRRLQGYVNLQSFACLWGLMPGSLTDEGSPFNECAHAYLAGARMLLLHLQGMPGGDAGAVHALVRKIEVEMLGNDAALMLCRYSDEPFNTAEVVPPHWREIPFHPPTALISAAGIVLILLGVAALLRNLVAAPKGA
jgi:hypothetical protein